MMDDIWNFGKLLRAAYLDGSLKRIYYWYMICVLGAVVVVYYYTIYVGFLGFAVLFSIMAGAKPVLNGAPPITIVMACGMILIMRYTILGGIDKLSKRTPTNIENRLKELESKIGELHTLAFGEVNQPKGGMSADLPDIDIPSKPSKSSRPVKGAKAKK